MSTLRDLLDGLAVELATLEGRIAFLAEEWDPRTALELLPELVDWLRLDQACTDGGAVTVQDQRAEVVRRMTSPGGQSPYHYSQLALSLGYDVEVEDLEEFHAFVAGDAEAGDELVVDQGVFCVLVHAPEVTARYARAGETVAGEPLVDFGNALLECALDEASPAHVVFLYVYDRPGSGYAPWNLLGPGTLDAAAEAPIPSVVIA